MNNESRQRFKRVAALISLILIGFLLRLSVSTVSSGPDVFQFWGFSKTLSEAGLRFYDYASKPQSYWTYPWTYPYPPLWVLLTGTVYVLAAPQSPGQVSWILGVKLYVMMADVICGLIIYLLLGRSWLKAVLGFSAWYFNPLVIYQSAVFGQFDSISAMFLLASIYLMERGRYVESSISAALSISTKQYTLFPFTVAFLSLLGRIDRKSLQRFILGFTSTFLALNLPFAAYTPQSYFRNVWLTRSEPYYHIPLCYSFEGIFTALTYLHQAFNWDLLPIYRVSLPLVTFSTLVSGLKAYREKYSPVKSALIGALCFLSFTFHVNYQYLVIYVPFILVLGLRAGGRVRGLTASSIALFPSIWLWMFDVTFWFTPFKPRSDPAINFLKLIGLSNYVGSDLAYVVFNLALFALEISVLLSLLLTDFWENPTLA